MFHILSFPRPSHTHVHTDTRHNLCSSSVFHVLKEYKLNNNQEAVFVSCLSSSCWNLPAKHRYVYIAVLIIHGFSSFKNTIISMGNLNPPGEQFCLGFQFGCLNFVLAQKQLVFWYFKRIAGNYCCLPDNSGVRFRHSASLESDHYPTLQTNEPSICCTM